eukprot:488187_1
MSNRCWTIFCSIVNLIIGIIFLTAGIVTLVSDGNYCLNTNDEYYYQCDCDSSDDLCGAELCSSYGCSECFQASKSGSSRGCASFNGDAGVGSISCIVLGILCLSLGCFLFFFQKSTKSSKKQYSGDYTCEFDCGFKSDYNTVSKHEKSCKKNPKVKFDCEFDCGFTADYNTVAQHENICAKNPKISSSNPTLPTGWRQVYTKDGKLFYQNDITKETSWNKPVTVFIAPDPAENIPLQSSNVVVVPAYDAPPYDAAKDIQMNEGGVNVTNC